jgi:hypothetical protein
LLYAWLRAIADGLKAPAKLIFFLKGAALEAFIQDDALTYRRLTCGANMGRDARSMIDGGLMAADDWAGARLTSRVHT